MRLFSVQGGYFLKYPHLQQHDETDCGAACLSMVSEFYGARHPVSKLRELVKVDMHGTNFRSIIKGAEKIGLIGEALEGNMQELLDGILCGEVKFPFIARIINEFGFEHFIVVYKIEKTRLVIGDPAKSTISKISVQVFKEQWQQQIIIFELADDFLKIDDRKYSFLKFLHYITLYKKMFAFIFFLSMIVTLVNMSGSVVFQYVLENTLQTDSNRADSDFNSGLVGEFHKGESRFLTTLRDVEGKLEIIFANVNTVCISVIFLYIFKHLIEVLRSYILAITAKKMDNALTLDFYNHLISLPVDFYGRRKAGELMSRFNDTEKIRSAISSVTLTIMLDTIMAIGCGIILAMINPILFIITLIMMILYAVVVFAFKKPIKLNNHILMENGAQVTSYLKESIDGIETIKAYDYEEKAQDKTRDLYSLFTDTNVRTSMLYTVMDNLISLTQSIGTIVLLWIGCALCIKDVISITDLIMFYYLLDYFLVPLQNLIHLQPELQSAMVAAERLNDVLDIDVEDNSKEELIEIVDELMLKDIDFRYGSRGLVLKGISMRFEKGKKTAIIGESGCGKTTVAKLIMAFYAPEKGKVIINDDDIFKYSPSSVRKKIAYVSQNTFLFSDTIYNNLRMGDMSITDEQIEQICRICYADEFIHSFPLGYNTVLEENGNNLSNGQKQRLSIARALLRNPDVMIFDEATSNLDVATEKCVKEAIDTFSSSMICIVIAHRLNTIKDCDNIYFMKDGGIVEEGRHTELLERSADYRNLLNLDFGRR